MPDNSTSNTPSAPKAAHPNSPPSTPRSNSNVNSSRALASSSAVRDLASGCQLAALPAYHDSAEVTCCALKMLFTSCGPPLVIKADNGSHFTADNVRQLLDSHRVVALHSPPRTPGYNGAIEAGIGDLKTRLFHLAQLHGRIDSPTSDDLEAARLQANACSRPFGDHGPSPDQAWTARTPTTPIERNLFFRSLERHRTALQSAHGMHPTNLPPRDFRATVERIAIRRTLEDLGYLVIRRPRFSPPVQH
ncbi:MAG: integrase catalytic domain-containing protein [Phycisphaerae bacterium]